MKVLGRWWRSSQRAINKHRGLRVRHVGHTDAVTRSRQGRDEGGSVVHWVTCPAGDGGGGGGGNCGRSEVSAINIRLGLIRLVRLS